MSDFDLSLFALRQDGMPRTIADRTRRIYDRLAAVYPLPTMLFHSKAHRAALQDSEIRDGMRVLEVATGSGEMFRRLVGANRSGVNLGLDLSPNMAARTQRRAQRRYPGSRTHCHAVDARAMPFRDESFDALFCCYLMELLSIDDILSTLSEFHRVLRSGARLTVVLIGQNGDIFNRIYGVLGSIAPAFWGRQVEARVPEFVEARGFRILSDRQVRQTGYPSRILVAGKGSSNGRQ